MWFRLRTDSAGLLEDKEMYIKYIYIYIFFYVCREDVVHSWWVVENLRDWLVV